MIEAQDRKCVNREVLMNSTDELDYQVRMKHYLYSKTKRYYGISYTNLQFDVIQKLMDHFRLNLKNLLNKKFIKRQTYINQFFHVSVQTFFYII